MSSLADDDCKSETYAEDHIPALQEDILEGCGEAPHDNAASDSSSVSGAMRSAWANGAPELPQQTSRWSARAGMCLRSCLRCRRGTESFHASRDLSAMLASRKTLAITQAEGRQPFMLLGAAIPYLKGRIRARHKACCPLRPCVPSIGIPRGSNERCIGCPSSYGSSPPVQEPHSKAGIASVPTAHDLK